MKRTFTHRRKDRGGSLHIGGEDHIQTACIRANKFNADFSLRTSTEVDGDVLPDLTAEDLIAIGVPAFGHRRKLLSAMAAMGAAAPMLS